MKRNALINHRSRHGAYLIRQGKRHSIYEQESLKQKYRAIRRLLMNWQGKSVKI